MIIFSYQVHGILLRNVISKCIKDGKIRNWNLSQNLECMSIGVSCAGIVPHLKKLPCGMALGMFKM